MARKFSLLGPYKHSKFDGIHWKVPKVSQFGGKGEIIQGIEIISTLVLCESLIRLELHKLFLFTFIMHVVLIAQFFI